MTELDHIDRRRFLKALGIGATGSLTGCIASGEGMPDHPAQSGDEPPYDSTRNVMVEMRDGVKLATDIYKPKGGKSFPTLVYRTPYNKDEAQPIMGISRAVDRGFAVVIQDVRGRFASEGGPDWEPVFEEGPDGYDTVEWAAEQPWSSGDVGMLGTSYMGMTTWLAALEDPPSLEAILPQIPSWYDYNQLGYQSGGILEMGNLLSWLATNTMDTINRLDVSEKKREELKTGIDELIQEISERGYNRLPLTDIPELDAVVPFWKRYTAHYTKDHYWNRVSVPQRIDQLSVPVLHVGGWYDAFKAGHNDVYEAIEENASELVRNNHYMIMGPWTHLTYGTDQTSIGDREFGAGSSSQEVVSGLALDWFDHWLTDRTQPTVEKLPKVQYFQMGVNEWREGREWPPSPSRTEYYLDSNGNANEGKTNGTLTTDMPVEDRPNDEYTFDPLDPVPTRGGTSVLLAADSPGVSDQSAIESRTDVLVYSTMTLDRDVEIAGPIDLTLFASSSAPDTDFVAKLVDVAPNGYAANIAEGGLRTRFRDSLTDPELMETETVYELPIRIRHTAHTFEKGHRIRLDVTSSNFPRFDRNPNDGGVPAEATEEDMTTADQKVYHDGQRPSRVTLPII